MLVMGNYCELVGWLWSPVFTDRPTSTPSSRQTKAPKAREKLIRDTISYQLPTLQMPLRLSVVLLHLLNSYVPLYVDVVLD